MTSSAQQLLDTTASFSATDAETDKKSNVDAFKRDTEIIFRLQQSVSGATDSINTALTASKGFYDQMADVIDSAFQTQSSDARLFPDTLQLLAGRVDQVIASILSLRDSIAQIEKNMRHWLLLPVHW